MAVKRRSSWMPDVGSTQEPQAQTDFGGGIPEQQNRQITDAMSAPAPAGFDAVKWADPTHTTPKYEAGRILGASGGIDDVIAAIGGQGYAKHGKDTIIDTEGEGQGQIFDLYFDEEGARTPQWTLVGGPGWEGAGDGTSERADAARLAASRGPSASASTGSGSGGSGGGSPAIGNVGQDPFSQLLQGGYTAMLGTGGAGFGTSDQSLARAVEAARMPYEIARKSQLNNARADLASRGLLGEPGHQSGLEVGAIQRIEEGLAPAYTGAINERVLQLDDLANQRATTFLDTLQGGTQRQAMLADVALQTLNQNRLWNQFLAEFGLDRDQVLWDMANGNIDQYLRLLELWIPPTQIAANGQI